MRTAKSSLRGFTLVELLVVMAIMSVLIGISVAGLGYAMRRSRNIARQAAVANLDRALESYYSDYQNYPLTSEAEAADIPTLIETTLNPYLEGSWDAPPKTCIAFKSDGIRYVTGANQEEAEGENSCFWAGPALGYDPDGSDWPITSESANCTTYALQTVVDYITPGSTPEWSGTNTCPDATFNWQTIMPTTPY